MSGPLAPHELATLALVVRNGDLRYVKVKSEEAAVRDVDVCVRTKDGRDGARVITTLSLWRAHAEMELELGSVLLLVGIKAGVNVYKPTGFLSLWSQEEWALIPNFNSDQANELKAWYNEEGATWKRVTLVLQAEEGNALRLVSLDLSELMHFSGGLFFNSTNIAPRGSA